MKHIFYQIAAVIGIYFIIALINGAYQFYKFKKRKLDGKSYFKFLVEQDSFTGYIMYAPFVFASLVLYDFSKTNLVYKSALLVLTFAVGVNLIVSAFVKPKEISDEEAEKKYKNKKLLIGAILFLLFSIVHFWNKELKSLIIPIYFVSFFAAFSLLKLTYLYFDSLKNGKELKSYAGFNHLLGYSIFSIVILILNWIY